MKIEESLKRIIITRIEERGKYDKKPIKYCDCCNEIANVGIVLNKLDENQKVIKKEIYLCSDHLEDLLFYSKYF